MYDQSRFSDADRNVRSTTLLPGLSAGSWAADGVVAVWTAGGGAGGAAGAGGVAPAVAMEPAIRARANGTASRRMSNRFRRGAGYRSSGA
ncbi:hypothetical protein BCEP27_20259 [Burkholderia cepacia]